MNIYQRVAAHAQNTPSKPALIYNQQTTDYKTLLRNVDGLAQGLLQKGVTSNTKVALLSPNNTEYAVCLLAAAKIGCALVPLPLTLKGEALTRALTESQSQYAIAWPTVAKAIAESGIIQPDNIISLLPLEHFESLSQLCKTKATTKLTTADIDSDYILTMTSGSTGQPKPIVLSQRTKIARAFNSTVEYYGLNQDDVVLVSTPLYHSLAERSLLMPLMLGATCVILPKFSVNAWVEAVTTHKVSFIMAVSSQLVSLLPSLTNAGGFASIRCLVSSSAKLEDDIKQQLLQVLSCHFHECYGASELGVVTDFDITAKGIPVESVGKPLPNVQVKITGDKRQSLPIGEVGEIACKSPTQFKGYFQLTEKTCESYDAQGFFYTGDLGYLDNDGYLYYVGRSKDVIKTGGISVYPSDIEEVIAQVEGINECAVVGVGDESFGEVIAVVYTLSSGVSELDESKMKLACLQQLTDYQQPRLFRKLEQLPKSSLGKILKPEIRKLLAEK